jgi:hypothetical protein
MMREEFWFWFGVWTSALALVIAGTVSFTDLIPAAWEPKVVKIAADFFAINNLILTAAKARGYLNAKAVAAVADTAKVAGVLIAAFALSLFLASGSAQAASAAPAAKKTCLIPLDPLNLCGTLTGKPQQDLQRVAKRIAKVAKADLTYAAAKAKAANTAASGVRLQCIQAIAEANDQANGAGLTNAGGTAMARPDPALVTAIEELAELVDNLSPQGKLFTSCAGAAQMFGTSTLSTINSIVTGATLLAAPKVF